MKLLILNGVPTRPSGRNPLYRGTYRTTPSYCSALPADHELNNLFMWYLEEGGETGVVHDLTKALRFANLWNAHTSEGKFEVVEVAIGIDIPESNGILLGFDLVEGYSNSLLQWGLKTFRSALTLPDAIRAISELLSAHFAPKLNSGGLFQNLETASFCLRSMVALQNLHPNLSLQRYFGSTPFTGRQ